MPTAELTFPFADDVSGTIRGYRVFTACRTVNGKIFREEDHLNRLYNSAKEIYMKPPMARESLQSLLKELLEKNLAASGGADLLLEIIFSGGLAGDTMKQSGKGAHLYVAVQPLCVLSAEYYEKGVSLATFRHQRMCPHVKLLNYVGAIIGHQTVVSDFDAYDVMFVDPGDRRTILEGSTFTVFFVDRHGEVVTPPLDGRILDSVTRRVVLEVLAPGDKVKLRERPVFLGELADMNEAFIASTTRSVLPVVRVDDITIGSGSPGPITETVKTIFQNYLQAY